MMFVLCKKVVDKGTKLVGLNCSLIHFTDYQTLLKQNKQNIERRHWHAIYYLKYVCNDLQRMY